MPRATEYDVDDITVPLLVGGSAEGPWQRAAWPDNNDRTISSPHKGHSPNVEEEEEDDEDPGTGRQFSLTFRFFPPIWNTVQ